MANEANAIAKRALRGLKTLRGSIAEPGRVQDSALAPRILTKTREFARKTCISQQMLVQ